jgi:copper oxidase (laccase) domain-containing protein
MLNFKESAGAFFGSRVVCGFSDRYQYGNLSKKRAKKRAGETVEMVARNRLAFLESEYPQAKAYVFGDPGHQKKVAVLGGIEGENHVDGYDGFLTADTGVVLTLPFCDCVPVYFQGLMPEDGRSVVGLCHFSRKNALLGVMASVVKEAQEAFGIPKQTMKFFSGLHICSGCYDLSESTASSDFIRAGLGRCVHQGHINLTMALEIQLARVGIDVNKSLRIFLECTCCTSLKPFSESLNGNQKKYFSHYRASQNGGEPAGSHLAFIVKHGN